MLRAPSSCTCRIPTPITFPTNSWKDFSSVTPDVKSLSAHSCKAPGFQTGSTLTARTGGRCQWEIKDGIPWTGKTKEHTPPFLQKASNCSSASSRADGSGKKGVWNISMRTPRKERNNKGITLPEKEIFRDSSIV